MKLKALAVGIALAAAAPLAMAEGFYGAFDLGQSKVGGGCDPVAGVVYTSCSDTDTSYRFAGGYNFSKNFGAEASYADYGKTTSSGTVLGLAASGGGSATAFQLVGTGILPLGDQFALTAKAGLAAVSVDVNAVVAGIPLAASANNNNFVWGIGAQFDLTKSVGIRVNYEDLGTVGDNATTGTNKLSNISAGVIFKF